MFLAALPRVQVRLDNNKLHFKDIRLEDAGMYQCVAENKHGMIVSSTWVHVLGEYLVLNGLQCTCTSDA